jgi:hypothetical protein
VLRSCAGRGCHLVLAALLLTAFIVALAIAGGSQRTPPQHPSASAAFVSESASRDGSGREKVVVKLIFKGSGWDGTLSVQISHQIVVTALGGPECTSVRTSSSLKPGDDPWHADRWGPVTETETNWGRVQAPGTANQARETVQVSEGTYSASPHTATVKISSPSPVFYST